EQVFGVAVKTGISTTSAIHLQPTKAQDLIREGAKKAMANVGSAKPFTIPETATVELEFDHQARADQASLLECASRVGERTIAFQAGDGLQFCRRFRSAMKLAGVRMNP